MILSIAGRELRSLFLSPMAWAILGVVQFIVAWMFLSVLDAYIGFQDELALVDEAPGVTEIISGQMLSNAAIVMLLVSPLLTMRLISEELRSGTIALLFSAPVSMTEIVLGKFVGIFTFMLLLLGILLLMPLSLLIGGSLDFGQFAAGVLGLALLLASFAAAGLLMSTLSDQPAVAAVATFGLLLLLWVIASAGGSGNSGTVFSWLSLSRHHSAFIKGVFNSQDLIYYLLFITTFLVLSIRRLDAYRLQN